MEQITTLTEKDIKTMIVEGEENRNTLILILSMNYHPYRITKLKDDSLFTDSYLFTIEI
jgi:hypothetical protein